MEGSQPPEGTTHLSHLQCWQPGTFNTTSDGCLQPASGTVAPAAAPGHPDNPTGKAGGHQDPAGEVWGTWGCRATLPFSWVLGWVSTEAGFVKGGEQSSQEVKV